MQYTAKRMTTTFLDSLPFGTDEFVAGELTKSRRERRKLPEGCRELVLVRDVMRIAWPSMVELLLASPVDMAASSTSLVGQSLGKKRPDMAEHYSARCVRIGIAVSVSLGLLQPVQTSQFILSGSLRGAGDTKTTAVITMIGILLLRPVIAQASIYWLGMGLIGGLARHCFRPACQNGPCLRRLRAGTLESHPL
ncbi:hypothetical protein [Lachnoclostridium sp. Marseille-P6806]|uniref:hypothetical protein n=1 Tax=Lachnoclostridium sp. Marseille-P6806 TaxID=2364793 RepID=UPI00102FD3A4|nr:hypothetical protein [Lachnoclostridium sp. Marseille-P6806]